MVWESSSKFIIRSIEGLSGLFRRGNFDDPVSLICKLFFLESQIFVHLLNENTLALSPEGVAHLLQRGHIRKSEGAAVEDGDLFRPAGDVESAFDQSTDHALKADGKSAGADVGTDVFADHLIVTAASGDGDAFEALGTDLENSSGILAHAPDKGGIKDEFCILCGSQLPDS